MPHSISQYKQGKASLFAQGAYSMPSSGAAVSGNSLFARAACIVLLRLEWISGTDSFLCLLIYVTLLFIAGKRRYDRKQSGFGGQTKPVFRKKVCSLLKYLSIVCLLPLLSRLSTLPLLLLPLLLLPTPNSHSTPLVGLMTTKSFLSSFARDSRLEGLSHSVRAKLE